MGDVNTLNRYALAYSELGFSSEAIELFKICIDLYKYSPYRFIVSSQYRSGAYLWSNYGEAFFKRSQYNKAVDAFNYSIKLGKSARPWLGLSYSLTMLGRIEEAIAAVNRAIEIEPKDADSWHILGQIYGFMKDFNKALPNFQKAVELSSEDGRYRGSLVGALRKIGQHKEALEQEKVARVLIEKENEYDRACFESICGNTEEALQLLKIALEKKQNPLEWAKQDPDFEFIRDDPRFRELVGLE
jgi:tetratricopeptide (TPR) repeat protein